jgi:hypothetical protein
MEHPLKMCLTKSSMRKIMPFLNWIKGIIDRYILPFFDKYQKLIVGIAALATCAAFFVTMFQVIKAKQQIRANFSYQIHKDGREIRNSIDYDVFNILNSSDPNQAYTREQLYKVESKILEVLMYYASAYHQMHYDNIDKSEWAFISADFCNFLRVDRVKEYWKNRIAKNELWDPEFRKVGEECIREKGVRK